MNDKCNKIEGGGLGYEYYLWIEIPCRDMVAKALIS